MPGKIVYIPVSKCRDYRCDDMPDASAYPDKTVWECDECGRRWTKYSGTQYNEPYHAWM